MQSSANQPDYSSFTFQAILVAGIALLLFHGFYYYPFTIDDSYISLRYSQRLITGHGLTWNDGEYVEGYSSLLWVLLNALLGFIGFDLEGSFRFLCLFCTILTPLAFVYHVREAKLPLWVFAAGMAAFVLMPPVGIWAIAGMEAPMVMLFFAWAVVFSYRLLSEPCTKHALLAGACLGALCLSRPEAPIYTVSLAGSFFLVAKLPMKDRLRVAFILCAVPCAVFLMQLGFRLYIYGQWVPNTVLAKVSFTIDRYKHGFLYTMKAWVALMPLLFYCFLNGNSARKRMGKTSPDLRFLYFLACVFFSLSAAILLGGGDIFYGFRAFLPLMPVVILGTMHALAMGISHTPPKKEMVFFLYIFVCHVWVQFSMDVNQWPKHSPWVQTARELGRELKRKYGDKQPLIAVYAAGAIPFYSELPTLDVYGLNDKNITRIRHEDKNFGHGLIGHELFDGKYVESRKPDILIFDIPTPLCDAFKEQCKVLIPQYRPEMLKVGQYDIRIYIRKDSKILRP